MKHDSSTIATLRRALDEIIRDSRFLKRKSGSILEIAEYLLSLAANGETDLEQLKSLAFARLTEAVDRAA